MNNNCFPCMFLFFLVGVRGGMASSGLKYSSILEQVRCQGISKGGIITACIPVFIESLLLPFVIVVIWRRPRGTLILLAIAIALSLATTTWDLLIHLHPHATNLLSAFRAQDIALGVTSSLPALFTTLATTTFLVTDLRPLFPPAIQSRKATICFTIVGLPILPLGFVGDLVGNILFTKYVTSEGLVSIKYDGVQAERMHVVISAVGSAATCAYLLIPALITLFLLSDFRSRARWRASFSSPIYLALISAGLGLIAIDIALSAVIASTFGTIPFRRLIRLAGRTLFVAGLAGSYGWAPRESRMQQDSRFQIIGEGEGSAGAQQPQRPIRPRGRTMSISAPILSSFQKLETRGAWDLEAAHRGGADAGGDGVMRGRNGARPVPMASGMGQRVLIRTPHRRAPVLSLVPSIFDSTALSQLTDHVSRPTPANRDYPYQARENLHASQPPRAVKKNIGSIYRPRLVTVDETDLAVWPPVANPQNPFEELLTGSKSIISPNAAHEPASRLSIMTDQFRQAQNVRQIPSSSHDVLLEREVPNIRVADKTLRVGQVSIGRMGDTLAVPLRINSVKRKAVSKGTATPSDVFSSDGPDNTLSSGSSSSYSPPPTSTSSFGFSPIALPYPPDICLPTRPTAAVQSYSPRSTRTPSSVRRSSSTGRPGHWTRRRDTDPVAAIAPRSPTSPLSFDSRYSDNVSQDISLFYRTPRSSIGSPTKGSTFRSSLEQTRRSKPSTQPASPMAPSRSGWSVEQIRLVERSMIRLRRDTGIEGINSIMESDGGVGLDGHRHGSGGAYESDVSGDDQSPVRPPGDRGNLLVVRESELFGAGQRISLNTLSSEDLTPRAGEVAWWKRDSGAF